MLGLLALLLGSNLEGLHSLLAPHSYCDVHAQFEHRELQDADHAAWRAEAEQVAGKQAGRAQLSVDASAEHESCALMLLASSAEQVLQAERHGIQTRLDRVASASLCASGSTDQSRLYRLAPKNSPPSS